MQLICGSQLGGYHVCTLPARDGALRGKETGRASDLAEIKAGSVLEGRSRRVFLLLAGRFAVEAPGG